jgi:hypothetical protein
LIWKQRKCKRLLFFEKDLINDFICDVAIKKKEPVVEVLPLPVPLPPFPLLFV